MPEGTPMRLTDYLELVESLICKRSNNPIYQLNNRQFYIFRQQFFNIVHRFTVR
jgi:hypothetical protein